MSVVGLVQLALSLTRTYNSYPANCACMKSEEKDFDASLIGVFKFDHPLHYNMYQTVVSKCPYHIGVKNVLLMF